MNNALHLSQRVRLVAFAACLHLAAWSSLGWSADSAPGAQQELEALRARVLGLEKSLGSREPTVSTMAAGESGARARVGAGDAARVQTLLKLVQGREGPALARELGSLLDRGEPAYATLLDFCHQLDGELRQALLLTYSYQVSFSLVHLAVLHRDELAKFAHFYLAASQGTPKSSLRRTLFDYLPDFLRYHRGRYPELEQSLEQEILTRLQEGKGGLQMYLMAMDSLGYKPPIDVFDPLLEAAASQAEVLPVVRHLQALDSAEAVRILSNNINRNPPGLDWKSGMMLSALARMSVSQAERALHRFLHAANDNVRGAALQAYFGLPRDESSLPLLREFLDSNVRLEQKRLVIVRLRQSNQGVLASLQASASLLQQEEVRKLLVDPAPRARK